MKEKRVFISKGPIVELMSDKRSSTAHLHLLHVFSPRARAAHTDSCSHCIFPCYHSSAEVSQPGDQMLCPTAMLLVLVSLVSQDLVFGAAGVLVAPVLRDVLTSTRDLPSTCAWGDPLVVPSWEHPGWSLPPASGASGDMCPSVPSPPPGHRPALQCPMWGHGAGW